MNHDDSFDDRAFENDLQATLGAIAREPAPERLVARISQIPNQEPVRQGLGSRFGLGMPRLGPGFAAVLGVVVIGLAVIVIRPALDGTTGVGASPTASPGSSAVAVVPSGSPSPTDTTNPSEVPSTGPATPPPTSVPTPSPSPSSAIAFDPTSVTFVSAADGWALGSTNCGSELCAAQIERTSDGGHTWTVAQAPTTKVDRTNGLAGSVAGVTSRIRFATTNDGWAFGPDLWATHDGGSTWTKVTVAGLPAGATVVALETSRGIVHAAFYDGAQDFRIASSPIGSDAWTLASVKVAVGGGPVPAVQLVLSGDAGWLLENDRTVTGGARLVNGTWKTWTPVCSDAVGPAYLAASSASDVLASCDVGLWSTPQGNHLFVSGNGGSTFSETGTAIPVTAATSAATPNTSTIVVAGSTSTGSILVASFNGGQTWSPVLHVSSGDLDELGFTNSSQGVAVTTSASGSGRLFMTRDGGHSWSAVQF